MSRRRLIPWAGALLVMVSLGAGCARAGTINIPRASSASPVGFTPSGLPPTSALASSSRASGSPGGPSATPSPTAHPSSPRSPEADATGTAGGRTIDLAFTMVVGYPLYDAPDGTASVAWTDDVGDTLSIEADPLFTGTRKTGPDAIVAIGLVDPVMGYNSGDGTCSLTITTADAHLFAGRFSCRGMKSLQGEPMTAEGSFSARLNATG